MDIALPGVSELIAVAMKQAARWVAELLPKIGRRRRERRDAAIAAGRRLADLMATQASLMTLMLAKHRLLAPAHVIADEASQLGQIVGQIESCVLEAKTASSLREPVDQLLEAALEAAQFALDVPTWRRADMTRWHAITQRWANERVRFVHKVQELATRHPKDVL